MEPLAAWRYGRLLGRWLPGVRRDPFLRVAKWWAGRGEAAMDYTFRRVFGVHLGYDLSTWLRVHGQADRVLAVSRGDDGCMAVIRARDLDHTELVRPDPREPWRLEVKSSGGVMSISGDAGLHVAGKLLAVLNGGGATEAEVRYGMAKVEDAGNSEGSFARVAAIAMGCSWGCSWGRFPDALPPSEPIEEPPTSEAEKLALQITKRSFWARGGIGGEPRTPLLRLFLVRGRAEPLPLAAS